MINKLASSGSAITLRAMIFLCVTPSVANATNRLKKPMKIMRITF
jgi:hypothetical protein